MVDGDSSTKRCPRCDTVKSLDCFGKAHQRPDGLQCWCRECKSKDHKDRWDRDPELRARILARNKAARDADPQKYKEYAAAYMKANRKKYTDYVNEWHKKNPHVRKACNKRIYERKKDQILAANKLWRAKNKDKCAANHKAYRKANPERIASLSRAYKARRYGAEGTHTKEDIQAIFKAQRGRCAYCRISVRRSYHVDHIVALKNGGSNGPRNLQITCAACNTSKHSKNPIVFAQSMGLLI